MSDRKICHAYCDGGMLSPSRSMLGGTWAWIGTDVNDEEIACDSGLLLVPYFQFHTMENNLSETFAAVQLLKALPDGWDGVFHCDSKNAIGRLFQAYRWDAAPKELCAEGHRELQRLSITRWTLLAGHPTKAELAQGWKQKANKPFRWPVSRWNAKCDDLCNARKAEYFAQSPSLPILPSQRVAA